MPRFYLDILNGGEVLEDPDGQAFADVQAARAEAAATARDLVAHGILRNQDLSGRSVLIRDDAGETVARVPFRSALPGTLSASPLPGSDHGVCDQGLLACVQADLERLVADQSRALERFPLRLHHTLQQRSSWRIRRV